MRLFKKDGGPLSKVWGLFIVEWKVLFSVVLLRFEDGSREAFHSHAFHAISWVLKGQVVEHELNGRMTTYAASWWPIITPRSMVHKVVSVGRTWVLTFRGPWANTWDEYLPDGSRLTLAHGREVVCQTSPQPQGA